MRCSLARLALATVALSVASLASTAQAQVPPTPEHKHLAAEVGVWDAVVQMWSSPDAVPMKSTAIETNKMFGDLWLLSDFEGEFGGAKFSGRMQLGYDPLKKKYVGTWIDTMSPYLQTMEGTYDAATKTSTMISKGIDVMTGKPSESKMVTRYESDDVKVFQILMPAEGQKDQWWKMMEIKYTRRK